MTEPSAVAMAILAAGTVLIITWAVLVMREERRRDRARKMAAARQAVLAAKGIDGTHEACEVPAKEQLIWEAHFEGRYPSLGKDVTKGTSA